MQWALRNFRGDGSGKVLQDYATTLFGEEFDEHSVITEDVLSPARSQGIDPEVW